MVSEEQFIHALIAAVEHHPVLYNVNLPDYKNKNKKGESFKSVQRAVRLAGCSEIQVQSTYKKWISLKRKFRVEYFRLKSEDPTPAHCNFRYFDALSFLVPYCHLYEQSASWRIYSPRTNGKRSRRHSEEFELAFNDDLSEDDSPPAEEDEKCTRSTLDRLLMSKAKKLKVERVDGDTADAEPAAKPIYAKRCESAKPQSTATASSSSTVSVGDESTVNSIMEKLFGSSFGQQQQPQQQPRKQQSTEESEPTNRIPNDKPNDESEGERTLRQTVDTTRDVPPTSSAQNALFARLVASEMDKLPESLHNVIRAQILLLLAHANSAASTFTNNTPTALFSGEKLFSHLFG